MKMSTAILYIKISSTFLIDCFMYTIFCGELKYLEPDLHSNIKFLCDWLPLVRYYIETILLDNVVIEHFK